MIKNFTHLHVHTTYSILDGISRREDLAKKAKEYGQTALAVTDHGNVFNAISFYKTCKDVNIKPIIGTEFYVAPDSRFGRTYSTKAKASEDAENGDISYHAYHLTVLARNRQGYENLKKLSTISYREGFYKKPRIDMDVLAAHKEGLIVMSGCLASITSRYIVAGQKEKAIEVIDKMRAIHGENFFLELMYHGIGEEEDVVNEALIDISNRHGVPLVMTNDSHFTAKGDEVAHEVALCVGTNKTLADPSHWKFNGEGYWFKTAEEMAHVASLASIPESALSNTELINSMVEDYGFKLTSNKHPAQIPLFRIDNGDALSEEACIQLLELKAWQGLAERGLADSKVHQERLLFELDMIKRKSFSSYFLIIADIIDGAMRKRGILPPIGRGSSMGSLVCYCLYIIGMDPVTHDVPFERFINEGRKDLPDIDTDISQEHRKEVIDYIVSRYGKERVAQIVTFQSMAAKAAIDNVGRALGVPSAIRRQVSKLLGDDVTKDDHVRELVGSVDRAKQIMEQTPNWIDISEKLEGNNKNLGAHAAGIVISNDPIEEHVPLIRDSAEGHRVTQYDMKDIAELGLLKLDMLGLKTMDLIQYTLELIERRHGIKLDYQGFPLDDAATFHNVANGKYVSVFQYDSSGIRTAARQLYPTEFNHLVALNALYRPGPMLKIGKELSIMEHYFERRHGREPVEVWHPSLKEVFDPTLGLCIEENQVVTLKDGIKKCIKDVVPGDVALSINSTYNTVSRNTFMGEKECITVMTETGRSLTLTKDHVLLANGRECKAGELSKGDFIHMPYESLSDGECKLNADQAYVIGVLLGDGSINATTPVLTLGNDEKWIESALNSVKLAWPQLNPHVYHNTRSLYANLGMIDGGYPKRNVLSSELTRLGIRKSTCKNKFIPNELLFSNNEIRAAVLAGLWDADGMVGKIISYTSESMELIRGVCKILSNFRISHYANRIGNRVYVRDTSKFMRLVRSRHPGKQDTRNRDSSHMRLHVKHLVEHYKNSGQTSRGYAANMSIARCLLGGKYSCIAAVTADKIDNKLRETYYELHDSERVTLIKDAGVRRVHDLSMEDTSRPWFTASGILVHNCIYQEQVMAIARIMGGFNETEADEYRSAIGKKDKVKFEAVQQKLRERGMENGHSKELMDDITAKLAGSARYNWNKGHALAYSYISYVTAYLETHFPYEYYTVLLNVNLDDNDQLKVLLSSIIQKGLKVLPPHINNSRSEFYTDGDAIYMGLFSVRMAGDTAVEAILKERDQNGAFKDFIDFCMRMSQYTRCNKTVKENLIKAGAFSWDPSITNKNKFENVELIQKIIKKFEGKVGDDLIRDQIMGKIVIDDKDWDQQEALAHERAVLNFYISSHPVMQYQPLFNLFPDLNIIIPSQLQEQQVGTRVVIAGVVEAREMKTTKKGDPFLRMRVGDQMGNIEVMVWSPLATQVFNRVPDNSMVFITGTIQEDKFRLGENTIYVNGVTPISNGIPINSYYAADVPTANTVAVQIGGEIASLSDQIMHMGHAVMLKNIAFIKPNDFAGLRTLRARYQING